MTPDVASEDAAQMLEEHAVYVRGLSNVDGSVVSMGLLFSF